MRSGSRPGQQSQLARDRPVLGHEGLRNWTRTVRDGIVDFRVVADEIIKAGEDRVVVVGRVCGQGAKSGLPLEQGLTTNYTVTGGKIVAIQAYDTREAALKAVGLR